MISSSTKAGLVASFEISLGTPFEILRAIIHANHCGRCCCYLKDALEVATCWCAVVYCMCCLFCRPEVDMTTLIVPRCVCSKPKLHGGEPLDLQFGFAFAAGLAPPLMNDSVLCAPVIAQASLELHIAASSCIVWPLPNAQVFRVCNVMSWILNNNYSFNR